ncbi:hypothetical protein [Streptomyces sp. NPDC049916]|uniref:hypothetical protein n=1 Tax=Streptomyces sp. NPDC049916 TaxID=3155156 RepID=UPI00344035AC
MAGMGVSGVVAAGADGSGPDADGPAEAPEAHPAGSVVPAGDAAPAPSRTAPPAHPAPPEQQETPEVQETPEQTAPAPHLRRRRRRRSGVALVGAALAAVAAAVAVPLPVAGEGSGAGNEQRAAEADGATSTVAAGEVLRAIAATNSARGSGAEGGAYRADALRYALAAWGVAGEPEQDDALDGLLARNNPAVAPAATLRPGLAPRGEVLAADVAPEGHRLAVLTRADGADGARMGVLSFGADGSGMSWRTVGGPVDPSSVLAISDCGNVLAVAQPDGRRTVYELTATGSYVSDDARVPPLPADGAQFLDFNTDTSSLLHVRGPREDPHGEIVPLNHGTPHGSGTVRVPEGENFSDVRLDGYGPAVVASTEPAALNRYGGEVEADRTDASARYRVRLTASADGLRTLRLTHPGLDRSYEAVLPDGAEVKAYGDGRRLFVVPVHQNGDRMRVIVLHGSDLAVLDARRADEASGGTAELAERACATGPQPLTRSELGAFPAAERPAISAAWPCDT